MSWLVGRRLSLVVDGGRERNANENAPVAVGTCIDETPMGQWLAVMSRLSQRSAGKSGVSAARGDRPVASDRPSYWSRIAARLAVQLDWWDSVAG